MKTIDLNLENLIPYDLTGAEKRLKKAEEEIAQYKKNMVINGIINILRIMILYLIMIWKQSPLMSVFMHYPGLLLPVIPTVKLI